MAVASSGRNRLVVFISQEGADRKGAIRHSAGVSEIHYEARGQWPNPGYTMAANSTAIRRLICATSPSREVTDLLVSVQPARDSKTCSLEAWRLASGKLTRIPSYRGFRVAGTRIPSFAYEPVHKAHYLPTDFDPASRRFLYSIRSTMQPYEYSLSSRKLSRLQPPVGSWAQGFYFRGRLFVQDTGYPNLQPQMYEASPDRKSWKSQGPYVRIAASASGTYWLVARYPERSLWLWKF